MPGLLNPFVHGGGGAPAITLLSLQSDLRAAYSFRKLFAAYAGAAVRQRQNPGSGQQDIGFSGDWIDTSAQEAHAGSNGWLVNWYDQSGNGRDVTSPGNVGADTPVITNTGSIGLNWLSGFGGGTGKGTIPSSVWSGLSAATVICMFWQSGSDAGWGRASSVGNATHTPWTGTTGPNYSAYESLLSTTREATPAAYTAPGGYPGGAKGWRIHRVTNTGSALKVSRNGVSVGTMAITFAGSPSYSHILDNGAGALGELLIFGRALSDSEADAIEAELDAAWAAKGFRNSSSGGWDTPGSLLALG